MFHCYLTFTSGNLKIFFSYNKLEDKHVKINATCKRNLCAIIFTQIYIDSR